MIETNVIATANRRYVEIELATDELTTTVLLTPPEASLLVTAIKDALKGLKEKS